MSKPLLRWTVGSCLQQGLDILAESVKVTTKALGVDSWDWAICYNGLSTKEVDFLKQVVEDYPVQLIEQDWESRPIPDNIQSPKRADGTYEWNGTRCGGTLWKACPARLRMESHEIVMDNDIIMLHKFPQIDQWLKSDKALILEEPIRFYGRYDHLFKKTDKVFLNSGFMGFPPNYDFGDNIKKNWEKHGSLKNLTQADEQGLLTYTLNQIPSIRIEKDQMIEVLHRDFNTPITCKDYAYHFTQSNRIPNHHAWSKYKEVKQKNRLI